MKMSDVQAGGIFYFPRRASRLTPEKGIHRKEKRRKEEEVYAKNALEKRLAPREK